MRGLMAALEAVTIAAAAVRALWWFFSGLKTSVNGRRTATPQIRSGIAGTAVYLASPASDFVTGATICVDGAIRSDDMRNDPKEIVPSP
jgi:NAD(P)-dependent dehydrogenase (short-subunit alcohol dehydrogenase family)